jgi:hypothetical protein
MALAWAEVDVFHKSGRSKESEKSREPIPGLYSTVGRTGWVGLLRGVLVGGNQRMVGVGVPVAGTGVSV